MKNIGINIVHLIAQDLSDTFTHISGVLFESKKSSEDMVVAGLDALSETMRTDGEFLKQHQLNDELLEKANRYLPCIFVNTEPAYGDAQLTILDLGSGGYGSRWSSSDGGGAIVIECEFVCCFVL